MIPRPVFGLDLGDDTSNLPFRNADGGVDDGEEQLKLLCVPIATLLFPAIVDLIDGLL